MEEGVCICVRERKQGRKIEKRGERGIEVDGVCVCKTETKVDIEIERDTEKKGGKERKRDRFDKKTSSNLEFCTTTSVDSSG